MPPWGSAPDPLSDHVPPVAVGRGDHVLLVVVIPSHRVEEQVEGLPAERAPGSPFGPLLDAVKAELVEAEGHVGCVLDASQADGAPGALCCLLRACRWQVARAAVTRSRAAVLEVFLGAQRHALPRETCKVLELFWRWERKSKGRPRKLWERGGKGLLKGLPAGWEAAAAAALWARQPQGLPCTPACPRQTAHAGRGRSGGTSRPGTRGRQAWAQGPGQGECAWLWLGERLQLGLGRSWGRTERWGAGPGCAPISVPPWRWAPGREGGRAGGEALLDLLSTSPVLKLSSDELSGSLGEELECPSPQSPRAVPQTPPGLAQGTCRQQSGMVEELPGILFVADIPGTLVTPTALEQALMGPPQHCAAGQRRGELGRGCLCSAPTAACLPDAKAQEQAKGPAGACTPCVCTHRSSGQNVRGQSPWLLKNTEVTGSHSCSLVTSQGCWGAVA